MTFQQLLAVLKARWLVAGCTFAIVLGFVTGVTLTLEKKYTAVASLLIDAKPDPIAGLSLGASPQYLMTQIDVITSNRVAQRVVTNLKLNQVEAMRDQWRRQTNGVGTFEAWLADQLRGGLDAHPSRGSNIILVTYTAADPYFATAITNGFVQAYLDTSMDLRTDPAKQFSKFFETNAKQLRGQLEAAQARLSDFQRRQNLVVSDERLDIETSRMNELSAQYVGSQGAIADTESRQAAALSHPDKMQEVFMNPAVQGLKSEVTRMESQLEQLNTRLGPEHPQVRELTTGLNDMRRKLDAEIKRVTSSVGTNNSINLNRAAQIRSALEEQRAKVMKLKSLRDEAAILQRDVDNAQRAYDGVLSRLNMTSLESEAVQANVTALEYANVPGAPSSGKPSTIIALGALGAAVVAALAALLWEQFDRRLRTRREIETVLEQPLIGSIPSFSKRQLAYRTLPDRMQLGPQHARALPN